MEQTEPTNRYRVSAKALILDDTRTKFLICLEDNGWWELPGGGLDWGESVEECLRRELKEEMGLEATYISSTPSYFMSGQNMKGAWSVNVVFEVKVQDLNFTKSNECQEIKFVTAEEANTMNCFRNVKEMAELFDPKKHANIQ
jgi:8-oxo-dGTP diphosphatase